MLCLVSQGLDSSRVSLAEDRPLVRSSVPRTINLADGGLSLLYSLQPLTDPRTQVDHRGTRRSATVSLLRALREMVDSSELFRQLVPVVSRPAANFDVLAGDEIRGVGRLLIEVAAARVREVLVFAEEEQPVR